MESPDTPTLRSLRRLNRHVHDPIADWIGAVLASLMRQVWPGATSTDYTPERQTLYGFTANYIPESREQ